MAKYNANTVNVNDANIKTKTFKHLTHGNNGAALFFFYRIAVYVTILTNRLILRAVKLVEFKT